MNTTPRPTHEDFLEKARGYQSIGMCLDAASAADEALALMEKSFAPNNPKLADAYALQAGIYDEVRRTFHGYDQLALGPYLKAARAEIEVRMRGMETMELARAKFLLGRMLATEMNSVEGFTYLAESTLILARLSSRDEVNAPPMWLYGPDAEAKVKKARR
jgi:hypothetical protein